MMDISALTHDDGYKLLVQETLNYAPELSGQNPFENSEADAPNHRADLFPTKRGQ